MVETAHEADHSETLRAYLADLRQELKTSDPALIHDALSGAEEHLTHHFNEIGTSVPEGARMRQAIDAYGSPREIAEAYREMEVGMASLAAPASPDKPRGLADSLFGVLIDPRAYGSLFYLFLSLATGIIYFTWAITGVSLSLGLSILIIGLPFTLLFLATVRIIALVEGRIVEGLLGERMPRRPVFDGVEGNVFNRVKCWLSDSRTWSTLGYMLLQLPLGIVYFVIFTLLLSLSLGLIVAPIVQVLFNYPIITFFDEQYYLPLWLMPIVVLAGFTNLLVGLHLARALGRLHANLAKSMLVGSLRG